MTPWWFHWSHGARRRALQRQQIDTVQVEGLEYVGKALDANHGVLLTPNHSFHFDTFCLLSGAEKLACPFYFMTAWQVFASSNWFQRLSMQRCGCFSVDREGTDLQAMKTAADILQKRPHPLVIFPEGDVYHTNDRITPFRDGAAAIAMFAAKKSERPIHAIPVAIKHWYLDDPSPSISQTLDQLERRLFWHPKTDQPLLDRIFHVAEGLLALKEIEHFGQSQSGQLPDRIHRLIDFILDEVEARYNIQPKTELVPERVKEIRRRVISQRDSVDHPFSDENQRRWSQDMDKMFLVTQLFSYPGNYLLENPSYERMAETVDKLEEDVLGAPYPTVRGRRGVMVRFDEPIEVPNGKAKPFTTTELTDRLESRVQLLLNNMKPDVLF